MDNIYEILFFLLIFILSGLSSYFENKKKKKAGGAKKKAPAKQQKNTAADILEQILGYKAESPHKPVPPVATENAEIETWIPEEEYEKEPEKFAELPETIRPARDKSTTPDYEYEKPKIKVAREENKSDSERRLTYDYRKNILEKLKNPETVREMVLISEILGKPKALRR